MIKGTNVSFGNEPTVYRTMAADQMNIQIPEGDDREAQLERNRLLKVRYPVSLREAPGRAGLGWGRYFILYHNNQTGIFSR